MGDAGFGCAVIAMFRKFDNTFRASNQPGGLVGDSNRHSAILLSEQTQTGGQIKTDKQRATLLNLNFFPGFTRSHFICLGKSEPVEDY